MTHRDPDTGRYRHQWGVVDATGAIEQCQHCGWFRRWENGRWKRIDSETAEALIAEEARA